MKLQGKLEIKLQVKLQGKLEIHLQVKLQGKLEIHLQVKLQGKLEIHLQVKLQGKFQIDLGKTSTVTGLIVQGRYNLTQWVTSVKVSYSLDDVTWTYALEPQCGEQKVYAANYNEYTPETILFPRPITARYVRIHPLTWHGHQAMRYEVLGIAG
ncbi:lactadherin-like [Strongylocentrotus purpuratus]|uniref:F5/8 type C domain-containing protein n=1 Tax=Strongylocentrotus purpuratus TaxID=7668 RepID=A0A7M7P3Y5_STRPU|nr:lactadherin-like [Strongylocentrotus purpuratus]